MICLCNLSSNHLLGHRSGSVVKINRVKIFATYVPNFGYIEWACRDFQPISRFIKETIQDMTIVAV